MNYKKHYQILCECAKTRSLNQYKEKHHVIPRCLGGTDECQNLVELTAEEHYVAHQLLVKIHPRHPGLIWAALQMSGHPSGKRYNNKAYGWLKRRQQQVAKQRTGKNNGAFGHSWYYNPLTLENVRCLPDDIPQGFIKGRKIKTKTGNCRFCNEEFTINTKEAYCSNTCKKLALSVIRTQDNKGKLANIANELGCIKGSVIKNKKFIITAISQKIPKNQILQFLGCNNSGANYETLNKLYRAPVYPRATNSLKG